MREWERKQKLTERGASFVALSYCHIDTCMYIYRQCLATLLSCVGVSSISLPKPLEKSESSCLAYNRVTMKLPPPDLLSHL